MLICPQNDGTGKKSAQQLLSERFLVLSYNDNRIITSEISHFSSQIPWANQYIHRSVIRLFIQHIHSLEVEHRAYYVAAIFIKAAETAEK